MKLSKDQRSTKTHHVETIRSAGNNLETAIESANKTIRELNDTIKTVVQEYNSAVEDANNFMEEILSEAEDTFDEKSELWQESAKGQNLQEFIDAWNTTIDPVDIDDIQEINDANTDADAATLEELPEEP